mgnify:CR=1 FL=1
MPGRIASGSIRFEGEELTTIGEEAMKLFDDRVVAVELIAAAQGFDLRRPLRSGPLLEEQYERVRALSPVLVEDRVFDKAAGSGAPAPRT